MTTDTDKASDKLVEMALKAAFEKGWCAAAQWAQRDDLRHDTGSIAYAGQRDAILAGKAAEVRAAIIADLCGDVEPVATYHGRCTIDCGEHGHLDMQLLKMIPAGSQLYSASTVAALKSRADALAARVVELEKDAWRLDAVEANLFEIHNPYKGSWVVVKYRPDSCRFMEMKTGASTVRAAIDAALAAKGQAS